jgi:ribonuclease R
VGMIGSGLFVRFGEVFEGFVPARRLHGEFFELNPLGTALRGRSTGRSYRLGDGIAVRVESITRNEGKVELALAPIVRPGSRSGGAPAPSARARGGK